MDDRKHTKKDTAALRAALAEECAAPAGETERAVRALAPQIGAAAAKLSDRRRERRSVRLQGLALAGCSVLFAAVATVAYQYRAILLAEPERWGLLSFVVLLVLFVGCLPILITDRKGERDHE